MKNFFLLLCTFLICADMQAQVPQRIVVEHFTNSRCGICANRNPGFFENLSNHEGIIHMAVHPSSPYSTCIFNQYNSSENDDRTNYYNVYGGTPRLVIQGTAISAGSNYNSPTIFDAYEDQMTELSIRIEQRKMDDMFFADVIVKAEADNNYGQLALFAAAVEDTVFYNAPNGENEHYDVFRNTFNGEPTGALVDIPANTGDSIIVALSIAPDAAWDYDRMYALAILQDPNTKAVVQANKSNPADEFITVSVGEINELEANVFPNPTRDQININLPSDESTTAKLFDSNGRLLQTQVFSRNTTLHVNTLPAGLYILQLENKQGRSWMKVVRS